MKVNNYEIKKVKGELTIDEKAMAVINHYQELEIQMTQAKMQMELIKEAMMKAMERFGVKSFENDVVKFTYVPESIRKNVDSKALKEQGLYEQFCKESTVKPSLRVSFKDA